MKNMSNYMTIQQAADQLGISTKTLRRWERTGYLVPDQRQEITGVRLYNFDRISYWKKLLALRRAIKAHLKELAEILKALDENSIIQDYVPGKPLKLTTQEEMDKFSKAWEAEQEWNKEFRRLLNELVEYPLVMRRATSFLEEEKT